jgi:cell division protein FtsB
MSGTTSGRRPTEARPGAARPVLTGRALVLGGIVVLLIVLLAAPIQRYLGSRSDINGAAQQLHNDRATLAQLTHQKALWSDPGYIQQQARTRLQYAMPGDTVYVVVDKGQKSDIETSAGSTSRQAAGPGWNGRLMDSVRAAAK